jgi:hypothetical protein
MIKHLLLVAVCFATALFSNAQSWTPLGCNESDGTSIAGTAAFVSYSTITADGTHYIAYIDDIGGPNNFSDLTVRVKKFNGTNWVNVGDAATPPVPSSDFFPIATNGTDLYLAYTESLGGAMSSKVTVKKLNTTTNQWEVLGTRAFSDAEAGAVGITAVGSKVYVGYSDAAFSNKIVVKVFDNNNTAAGWQTLGTPGFSNGAIVQMVGSGINIKAFGNDVYVSYMDISLNSAGGLVVQKFNGTNWSVVGGGTASGTNPGYSADLAIDNAGKPYVAYFEPNNSQAIVATVTGGVWSLVGGQPAASAVVGPVSLTVIGTKPYLAYTPTTVTNVPLNAIVKGFNTTTGLWEDAGTNPATNTANNTDVIDVNLLSDNAGKLHLNFHNTSSGLFVKTYTAGVLPVTLSDFTAEACSRGAILRWTGINESNLDHYEIEYATAPGAFIKVAMVTAKNLSSADYSFTVPDLAAGKHSFRLKIYDKDGKFTYSSIKTITTRSALITVFPNPAKDQLTVRLKDATSRQAIITTLAGTIVRSVNLSATTSTINISTLAAGNYILKLATDDKTEAVLFVKQ